MIPRSRQSADTEVSRRAIAAWASRTWAFDSRYGLHQLDAVGPGQHQIEQDQSGLFGLEEARQIPRIAGDQRGVARLRQCVAEMAQRLRVVIDHQDGHRVRGVARRAGAGRGGTVACRLGHRDREGEARAEADAAALGPDAPPLGLDQALADREAQPAAEAALPVPGGGVFTYQ